MNYIFKIKSHSRIKFKNDNIIIVLTEKKNYIWFNSILNVMRYGLENYLNIFSSLLVFILRISIM